MGGAPVWTVGSTLLGGGNPAALDLTDPKWLVWTVGWNGSGDGVGAPPPGIVV